ncbi:MAG: hypothetical protein EPN91_01905 [Salinibacterium sp.]|nr:MAG: hypothetical protein EPN91_01905 [Salinibacterium sp.]
MSDIETKQKYGWGGWLIAALFALVYAYDLWEAISNFVELPAAYQSVGLDVAALPWWVLWIGLLVPPVVFGLAFWIGRRENLASRALIFLVGWSVVAGLSLSVIGLEELFRPVAATIGS